MADSDQKSRGQMTIARLFNADEIGVSVPEPHPNRALRIFLDDTSTSHSTAIASRVIKMQRGVLFLMAVEEDPRAGVICLYDRDSGDFFSVIFEGNYDHISTRDFNALVSEYGLLEYAVDPTLITQTGGHA